MFSLVQPPAASPCAPEIIADLHRREHEAAEARDCCRFIPGGLFFEDAGVASSKERHPQWRREEKSVECVECVENGATLWGTVYLLP